MLACALQTTGLAKPIQQANGTGVIVGTVVDEQHVPVARAEVQAFSADGIRTALRSSQPVGPSTAFTYTDERGTFRISGLAAGDYAIAARTMATFPSGAPLPARAYGPTFYPSTLDASQAVVVTAVDRPETSAQIELVPVKPVRVTGTVISASGQSTEGFDVRLFSSFGGFGSGATVAVVGTNGKFEIPRVPPGVYDLTLAPRAARPDEEGREFVDTTIDVTDHDLDLSLTIRPGASVTGRIVAEPPGAVTTPIGLRVTVSKTRNQFAAESTIAAAVNGDWSFRMTGLSGSYEFHVSSDRSRSAVATRIVVNGTSYRSGEAISFAEGDHDVVVFVAPREVRKPAVDSTQSSSALVEQFKNERAFWKQIEIAQAIAGKQDASVLPPLADWLDHQDRHIRGNAAFIFASLGDPRGLQTIVDILADRSDRPEGQGDAMGSDGRYRFERQVAADRYYAAHRLGDLRDPRGIPLLVPLLDDPETKSIVPWSLGHIGDKRSIQPLIAALENDDPSQRVLVIYALEELQAKEAVPRLLQLVNDDRKARFGAGVSVAEAAKAALAKLQ